MSTGAAVEDYFRTLPFAPDPFQREAVAAVERDHSVVVTAPTGAGKTVVAEAAVALAVARGQRSFYTTPIKALSNQKYGDFKAAYGEGDVGLLTGDNSINGDAAIVVMTTEVLRNMIYADSAALHDLGVVILDEVHYLQDRYRGAVWEEVIIHLEQGIPLVCLSATIANAEEFTDWVRARRGPTELVVESERPVPLESLYMVKDRHREGRLVTLPIFTKGNKPNPEIERLLKKGRGRSRRFATPRRLEVVEELHRDGLLPAIYFIFSRAGCDQAADFVAAAGLGFTTPRERVEIASIVEKRTAHLDPVDLEVLGYGRWLANLQQGVGAHHAGLVPAFKEVVEELFGAGLLRVVFATETLALGINMPARTVVLEKLTKFDGETHVQLKPGDYTQLTGRAGRRGIDTEGTAVVLHSPFVGFREVASIAAQGSHALVSSFQPTYNMAVNLVANYDRERAETLLNASFAQFRMERRRQLLARRIAAREHELATFRAAAECELGDIWDYVERAVDPKDAARIVADFVQRTHEGDVLRLTADPSDRWVLVARSYGANPRLLLVSDRGVTRRVTARDLGPSLALLGHVDLPEPVRTREAAYLAAVAERLRSWSPEPDSQPVGIQTAASGHPVERCPDLGDHLQWARRAEKLEREIRRLRRRAAKRDDTLLDAFRAVRRVLAEWGYVDDWKLTAKGERLRFVYNERDLLLAESIERGWLDGLDAPSLAAVASMFTFEARAGEVEAELPTDLVAERASRIVELGDELNDTEERLRVPPTRPPDPGFATIAYDWAREATLDELFEDDDLAAGDFVRNARQLLDLLRQLRDAYPSVAETARAAIQSIDRGVVAAGGVG